MGTGRRWAVLAGFVVASFAAAVPGGLWPPGEWYAALDKPWWNPPSWLFGPVWSLLYALMGIAAWRVWCSAAPDRAVALRWWWAQLVLNAAWTPLFFGLRRPDLAFLEILALEALIIVTIWRSFAVDRVAAALLVPYAAWVGFASVLNLALWRLNP
jgi:tryptophan-rich sensory protein